MQKLGIIANNLGANQLSQLLSYNINEFMLSNYKTDIIVFYEDLVKQAYNNNFACMPTAELWGYDGNVLCTSINLLQNCAKIPSIKKVYMYLWELEWIYQQKKQFEVLRTTYNIENVTYIARNEEYANLVNKMWGTPINSIIENLNINKILEIVCQKST